MPLTDPKIRGAKPAEKPYKLTDERGLFLLVNPNGSRLWRLRYKIDGKEKLLALGAYPDVSLVKARKRRDDAREEIADGRDPAEKRKIAKAAAAGLDTFGHVAAEWFTKARDNWTEGHRVTVRSRLDRDVLPYLKARPLAEIDAPEVLAVVRRVEARGAIESAHRIKTIISQVFAYAIATGQATRNPANDSGAGAIKPARVKPMAAILDTKEVGALLRAIDDYKGTHVVRCAFLLTPLVFVRPGELRAAEWCEFDLDAEEPQWVIPARRMKLRLEHKDDPTRSHIVPLSRQAVAILRDVQRLTGEGRYVFPATGREARPMSENALTVALRRMGYQGQMTAHGFRAIASTLLNERGFNPDAIEAQLAHTQGSKVRAAYNRARYLPERRKMMQAWADYLDTLRADTDGKVVQFPSRVA